MKIGQSWREPTMSLPRIPRILFIIPGLLAGLLVPALASAPKSLPSGAVGMTGDDFAQDSVTIHADQRLLLFNDSNVVHVIGPGRGGRIIGTARHVPVSGFHLMQTNSVYRTKPWKTPGTYYITCSVHPDMTLKVIVAP
ncbi:MAG: cupredoxin domain-containing protein [Streptosporangiaceae bacterium]